MTPAMLAAVSGQVDCLAVLIAAGADVEAVDPDGRTGLDLAKSKINNHGCIDMLTCEMDRLALTRSISPVVARGPGGRI